MREEFWKDVEGFDGIYQISNLGNVRKIVDGGFKYKNRPSDGRIELYDGNGERTRFSINHLIYTHFGIPSEEGEVWGDIDESDVIKVSNQGRLLNIKTGHFLKHEPEGFSSVSKLMVQAFGLPTEEGEEWKDIDGFEGYQVSSLGRVRNIETGRILHQYKNDKGYSRVNLFNNCNRILVHRLVADAFVPNPDPLHFDVVNHKNCDPTDNRASNLEWCDTVYNSNYKHGRNYNDPSERLAEIYEKKRKAKLDKCKTEEERQNVLKAQDYADASRRYYWKHKK